MCLPLLDNAQEDIAQYFTRVADFLDAVPAGERTLVHCMKGKSRSATVLAAYLMRKENSSALDAVQRLQTLRPVVRPNPGFLRQLREWETALTASKPNATGESRGRR